MSASNGRGNASRYWPLIMNIGKTLDAWYAAYAELPAVVVLHASVRKLLGTEWNVMVFGYPVVWSSSIELTDIVLI